MNYGTLLISKAIEANDPNALLRFNIAENDLPTQGERKAFRYVMQYAERGPRSGADCRNGYE
nr:hypothetical protein P5648_13240 [Bacillus subtilis]